MKSKSKKKQNYADKLHGLLDDVTAPFTHSTFIEVCHTDRRSTESITDNKVNKLKKNFGKHNSTIL